MKLKGVKVTIDEFMYIDAMYLYYQEGKHFWNFNIVDEDETIGYIVYYQSDYDEPSLAADQMLNDCGAVNLDVDKVVWPTINTL